MSLVWFALGALIGPAGVGVGLAAYIHVDDLLHSRRAKRREREPRVTHAYPLVTVTPCCGRTFDELPQHDPLTQDPDLVTCKGKREEET